MFQGHCLPSRCLSNVSISLFAFRAFTKCSCVNVCHQNICQSSRVIVCHQYLCQMFQDHYCHQGICQLFQGHDLPSGHLPMFSESLFAITTFANVPGSLFTIRLFAKCFRTYTKCFNLTVSLWTFAICSRVTVCHQDICQMFLGHCCHKDINKMFQSHCHQDICHLFHGHHLSSRPLLNVPGPILLSGHLPTVSGSQFAIRIFANVAIWRLSSVPWSLFAIWRFVECSKVTVCHLMVS